MTEILDQQSQKETERFISKRMVIKIGSSSLTRDGNPLNIELIQKLADQVATLYKSGVEVVIVSSGAVASGKEILKTTKDDLINDQIAAIYGQNYLMDAWNKAFAKHQIPVGQVLFSEDDLKKPNTPIIMGMKHGIQIINANDAINDSEMKEYLLSSDNDKLSGHIAKFVNADTLLLLTDVNGVIDNNGNVISEMYPGVEVSLLGKSSVGTGGMNSKVNVGFDCAQNNIRTVIASANQPEVILKVARGEQIGTSFVLNAA